MSTSVAAPSDPKAQALLAAGDAAVRKFSDTTLVEIKQRNDATWEVTLVDHDGYIQRLTYSSDGRTLVDTTSIPPKNDADVAARLGVTAARIDYKGALNTLLAQLPPGAAIAAIALRLEVTDPKLVNDPGGGPPQSWPTNVPAGHPVWFTSISSPGSAHDVVIDAVSGNVLR